MDFNEMPKWNMFQNEKRKSKNVSKNPEFKEEVQT